MGNSGAFGRFEMTQAVVTTSWDDGHPLDLRVAELLARYGLTGTFYVPLNCSHRQVMDKQQLLALRELGMEVGSHTMTHPQLTKISRESAMRELTESKDALESALGERITAFCYPYGAFNPRVSSLVRAAGYRLGRTTVAFRTEKAFDPRQMPVSFQFVTRSMQVHVRHALKEANFRGLRNWQRLWGCERDLRRLSAAMLDHVLRFGGVLHFWGHSWEIEQLGLWSPLEDVLRMIGERKTEFISRTNSQVVETVAV